MRAGLRLCVTAMGAFVGVCSAIMVAMAMREHDTFILTAALFLLVIMLTFLRIGGDNK